MNFKRHIFSLLAMLFLVCSVLGFTIDGSKATTRLNGITLGGIGTGGFNILPTGLYNRQWLQNQAITGVEPTIFVYTSVGGTAWSTQALTTAGGFGITYTGYWPKATLQYSNSNLKIELTLEAFSPLYPGSDKDCSMPLAFFVFKLHNPTAAAVSAAIACRNNATSSMIMNGTTVQGIAGSNITMMVKNDGAATVSCGSSAADFTADGQFGINAAGGILASLVTLQANETRYITFVISWDNIAGYYRTWYTNSRLVAQYGYDNAETLKSKVENWHNKILNSNLPDWYKDVLINNCHGLNSQYDWQSGGFAQGVESVTDSRVDCFDQRVYSSIITPIFAPQCEYQIMKKYATDQAADGHILYAFGYTASKNDVNSMFPVLLLRNYMWTGQSRFITEFYSNIKKCLQYNKTDDANSNGLPDNQFSTFDQPYYDGWMPTESEYCSHFWLTGLQCGKRFAEISNDAAQATTYQTWYNQASTTFEKAAGSGGYWNNTTTGPTGLKGYYTGSNDLISSNAKGRACWASQLSGQWYADLLQLGLMNPQGRIDSAIAYIDALNSASRGYYLCILPDKSNWFGKQPGGNTCGEQWPWFPPAHFGGVAISQGFPDIGMKCIYSNWLSNYAGQVASVGPIPWNSPVFMMVDGSDAPNMWGAYRYQNPPGVFSTLFDITGFSIDIAAKKLWIKPSIPTVLNKKLSKAPLINPISCGTLDYSDMNPKYGQDMTICFDSVMKFTQITIKDQNSSTNPIYITVTENSSPVTFSSTRKGSGKSAEIVLSFQTDILIDNNGIRIQVSDEASLIKNLSNRPSRSRNTMVYNSLHHNPLQFLKTLEPTDFIEIYDVNGKLIKKGTVKSIINNITLSKGVHIYRIQAARP